MKKTILTVLLIFAISICKANNPFPSIELNTVYTYTLYPHMSYASYEWSLPDQRETNYEIVGISGNTLQIKFKRNAIFLIDCDIRNASNGEHVYTAHMEVLAE